MKGLRVSRDRVSLDNERVSEELFYEKSFLKLESEKDIADRRKRVDEKLKKYSN